MYEENLEWGSLQAYCPFWASVTNKVTILTKLSKEAIAPIQFFFFLNYSRFPGFLLLLFFDIDKVRSMLKIFLPAYWPLLEVAERCKDRTSNPNCFFPFWSSNHFYIPLKKMASMLSEKMGGHFVGNPVRKAREQSIAASQNNVFQHFKPEETSCGIWSNLGNCFNDDQDKTK